MIFSLKNIKFVYSQNTSDQDNDDQTVDGIQVDSLDILATGITAIIGPSGSGKTTLLSILAKFLEPETNSESSLKFNGLETISTPYKPGQVAFVFQSPMLLGAATTAVNILQGVSTSKTNMSANEEDNSALKLLEMLGLLGKEKQLLASRARHLSGGEAQRAAVSRALLANPEVVLCDEPTSALDVYNAGRVLEQLRKWSHENSRAVVWVTHNLDQAATYADNFVFVSKGQIYEPSEDLRNKLESENEKIRFEALTEISTELKGHDSPQNSDQNCPALPKVNAFKYSLWISNALSTDGPRTDKNSVGLNSALVPHPVQNFLTAAYHRKSVKGNFFSRLWLWLRSYSRYGLVVVLTALLAQIFLAIFLGSVAETYATKQLQDPAIARIVFEHVIDDDRIRAEKKQAADLYADSTLLDLEKMVKKRVSATGKDGARVHIFGRRIVDGSKIRLPNSKNCAERWYSYDTVALDWDDPLFLQMKLAQNTNLPFKAPQAVINYAKKHEFLGVNPETERSVQTVDERLYKAILEKCEPPAGVPVKAQWAVGAQGEGKPHTVEIIAAMSKPPPIYPNAGQIIAFEQDFNYVVSGQTGDTRTNFRIATAYFPIDAFSIVREVIEGEGYLIRDDSEAAIEAIKKIARGADILPFGIIVFNVIVCLLIILLTTHAILELNKRVFALFIAQGFQARHLLTVLAAHLLPAALLSTVFGILLLSIVWPIFLRDMLPADIGNLAEMRNFAFLKSTGILFAGTVVALIGVNFYWLHHIRKNLKTFLQD